MRTLGIQTERHRSNGSFCRFFFAALLVLGMGLLLVLGGCAKKPKPHMGPPSTRPYTVRGVTYYPLASAKGYDETGIASWYGSEFHGRMTSSGEYYDQNDLTCAHTILPFYSVLRVTNLSNGKSVDVRVNDRGPFSKNRLIDLSKAAAKKIGLIGPGSAKVRVCALEQDKPEGKAEDKAPAAGASAPEGEGTLPAPVPAAAPAAEPAAEPASSPATYPAAENDPAPAPAPAPADGQAYYVQVGVFKNLSNVRRIEAKAQQDGYAVRILPMEKGRLMRVLFGPWHGLDAANAALWKIDDDYPQAFLLDENSVDGGQ